LFPASRIDTFCDQFWENSQEEMDWTHHRFDPNFVKLVEICETWPQNWHGPAQSQGAARFHCFARCGRCGTWALIPQLNVFDESYRGLRSKPFPGTRKVIFIPTAIGLRQQFRRNHTCWEYARTNKIIESRQEHVKYSRTNRRTHRVRMIYWQIFSQQPDGPPKKYDARNIFGLGLCLDISFSSCFCWSDSLEEIIRFWSSSDHFLLAKSIPSMLKFGYSNPPYFRCSRWSGPHLLIWMLMRGESKLFFSVEGGAAALYELIGDGSEMEMHRLGIQTMYLCLLYVCKPIYSHIWCCACRLYMYLYLWA